MCQLQSNTGFQDVSNTAFTSDWARVEEHLRKHDEGVINKYDGDMDTLLVFVSFGVIMRASYTERLHS